MKQINCGKMDLKIVLYVSNVYHRCCTAAGLPLAGAYLHQSNPYSVIFFSIYICTIRSVSSAIL